MAAGRSRGGSATTPRGRSSSSPRPQSARSHTATGGVSRDVAASLRMAAVPLMEVAPRQRAHGSSSGNGSSSSDVLAAVLSVHEATDANSAIVTTLREGERVHVLGVVDDYYTPAAWAASASSSSAPPSSRGIRRALVVRKGEDVPLGFVPLSHADDGMPTLRPAHARPLFIVVKPAIVRRRCELTSDPVCTLEVGTKVYVIDARRLSTGAQRVCVVREIDVLEDMEPLGWITARRMGDGTATIHAVGSSGARDALGDAEQLAKDIAAAATSASAVRPTNGASGAGGAARSGAQSARSPARSTKPSVAPSWKSAPSDQPTPRWSKEYGGLKGRPRPGDYGSGGAPGAADAMTMSPLSSRRLSDGAGSGSGGGGAPGGGGKKGKPKGPPPLATAEKLTSELSLLEANVLEAEAQLALNAARVSVQLGEYLVKNAANVKVPELVASWAKRGVEPISRMEFRQHVRKLLGSKADVKQVDELFDSLDEDRGGTLDVDEIRVALRKLMEDTHRERQSVTHAKAGMARQHERIALVRRARDTTREAETAAVQLAAATSNPHDAPIRARLGNLMAAKHLKVSDIIVKWGGDDGSVDRKEFRENVLALGLVATTEELNALFAQLDSDGGGSLDMAEIKTALRKLSDEAAEEAKAVRVRKRSVTELQKTSKALQLELFELRKQDEVMAAEAAAQAVREAEERIKAEAEAKIARAEAKKAEAAAKKAEKEAFAAKIAAKREEAKRAAREAAGGLGAGAGGRNSPSPTPES